MFLNFGPAGDLPIHLIFLLGKHELGIAILEVKKRHVRRLAKRLLTHAKRMNAEAYYGRQRDLLLHAKRPTNSDSHELSHITYTHTHTHTGNTVVRSVLEEV